MSRYHSICETCSFEDTNDEETPEDCGHPFFAIVDHLGHHDDDDDDGFCPGCGAEEDEAHRDDCDFYMENRAYDDYDEAEIDPLDGCL